MEDISSNIEQIRKQIDDMEMDKQQLIKKNQSGEHDEDIAIVESEIIGLEKMLESEITRYNEISHYVDYQLCCNHVFVDDLIDIDPDNSKQIKYCVLCLFTDEK
jgi:hypothetical protein